MEQTLAGHSLGQLIGLARRGGHRLSRDVVDELARRGDGAVDVFEQLLREPWPWDDEDLDAWWLRLHAVMAMGLIPTERAGAVLLAFLERIGEERDDELQDWLSGYWPALLRNKPGQVAALWRESALDRSVDVYMRAEAAGVVVALAEREGPESLESALDWASSFVADGNEELPMRSLAASCLLDFPRERHRALLLEFIEAFPEERVCDVEEVEAAFADGTDAPAWSDFADPWNFYDPAEMDLREAKWAEEEASTPYVRETPKIGRNDPCPCGSGKKYKRCCGAESG